MDLSKPLDAFASDLRRLRDSATPIKIKIKIKGEQGDRVEQGEQWVLPDVRHVVKNYGVSSSSIYAALSARRLPSRTLLRAMVLAWDPRGENALPNWMNRRLEVETALSLDPPVVQDSITDTAEMRTAELDEPEVRRPEPVGGSTPSGVPSMAVGPSSPSALTSEVRRLYVAAGRPSLRAISEAVLTDSESKDVSAETIRRVISGAHAKQGSVIPVARALAALNGDDVAAAEETTRQLQEAEEVAAEAEPAGRKSAGETPSVVDLRGTVIYGLQLIAGDGQTIDLRNSVLNQSAVRAGDQQTLHIGGSTLNESAVRAGDQQTLHIGGSTLNETAVRAGDQQTLHIGGSTLNETAVRAGDQQTLHIGGSTLNETAVRAGDQQTLHIGGSTLNQSAVRAGGQQTLLTNDSVLQELPGEVKALPSLPGTDACLLGGAHHQDHVVAQRSSDTCDEARSSGQETY
ncbi:hypothetical protein ACICHK_31700 [Streptomyces sp. AHU1]|uniref:hypothetical protein n=1 Tax=Streptomyces sp. AHU1 TaxID=3377215 RepID=UPI0038783E1D